MTSSVPVFTLDRDPASLHTLAPAFSTGRMSDDYIEWSYAAAGNQRMRKARATRGRMHRSGVSLL